MIKPPEKPVGPDFDKARDWVGQQERLMTEAQACDYDKLKKQQAKDRQAQQQKLDRFRKELEQKARQRQAISELVYNPPIKTADPHVKKIIANVIAAEKDLSKLNDLHKVQRIKKLEVFEQQREEAQKNKENVSNDMKVSWKRAVEKTARRTQERERTRDLTKDFGKTR